MLQGLRKHRQAIARIALPALAAVWLNASASPCLAMALEPEPAEDPALGHVHGTAVRDHGGAHAHGGCPHCAQARIGGESERAASHISCSATADLAGSGERAAALKWDLKHALSPSPLVAFESDRAVTREVHPPAQRPVSTPLSLHLRYCVFLN